MPGLIRNRTLVADRWHLLREATTLSAVPVDGAVIVPLALWKAERTALRARGVVGVWLAPGDDPDLIADDVALLPVIAVDFPQFADGRGYSTARLLRQRHGFANELRAIGDILRDQLFALEEVGFDAMRLRADQDADAALASFEDFRSVYAPTVGHPAPWFRRRHGGPSPDGVWMAGT
jgi:uncharacterized protein (DUF934 family)